MEPGYGEYGHGGDRCAESRVVSERAVSAEYGGCGRARGREEGTDLVRDEARRTAKATGGGTLS